MGLAAGIDLKLYARAASSNFWRKRLSYLFKLAKPFQPQLSASAVWHIEASMEPIKTAVDFQLHQKQVTTQHEALVILRHFGSKSVNGCYLQ